MKALSGDTVVAFPGRKPNQIGFARDELQRILNLCGRMVAAGEWRDYAMDFTKDAAVFAAFRRVVPHEAIVHQRIESGVSLDVYAAAIATIAAVGAALGDVLLPPEAQAAIAPLTRLHGDRGFIDKFHGASFLYLQKRGHAAPLSTSAQRAVSR